MRVLIATVPWPTHYFGLVPLAWALRVRGHEVRVACQPSHMDTAAQSGLPAVRIGRDVDFMSAFQSTVGPLLTSDYSRLTQEDGDRIARDILSIFVTISEAMVDDMLEVARAWGADLIMYEPATFAAPVVAAVLGIPTVRCLWGPDITYNSTHLEDSVLEPMCRRFGLDSVDTLGTVTVDPCPPSMLVASEQLNRQLVRYVAYNGPGHMPDWLLEPPRRPRVCLTWGTSTVKLGGPETFLLPYALRAALDLGVEVILAIAGGQRELLGELPDGVRVAESLPLHMLLPTCDAIVHQGGAGTTLTAAACGTPQLIIPQVLDQMVNAFRVQGTGAGLFFLRRELTGDAMTAPIRATLEQLLGDPAIPAAAERLRAEMEAAPSPADVAASLEELVADRQAAGVRS